jgi:hypothetical protein
MNTSPTANGRLSPIFSFGNSHLVRNLNTLEIIWSRTPRRFNQVKRAIDVALWDMPTGPDDARFQGKTRSSRPKSNLPARRQSASHPGRRRAVDPKATEGRTAQKLVAFGINHSLTILRSTVAALFSHSYRPPWGICRMTEVVAAAGVIFSISIFVVHAFDAYRTR